MMKLLRSTIIALAIGVSTIPSAFARDSFSLGVNVGGYGYPPPVTYYPAPRVVYYDAPTVYYRSAPQVYYQPLVSYRYYDDGRHGYGHGRGYESWGHEGRVHRGWGRGGDDDRWGHGYRHHEDRH